MSSPNCTSWPAYRFLKRQVRCSGIPISLRISHILLWYIAFSNHIYLVSSICDIFSIFSWFLWLWYSWKVLVSYFVICPSIWVWLVFSWSDWANAFGARISQKSCCVFLSLPYTEGCVISIHVIAGDLLLTVAGTALALEAFLMAAGCGILVLADSEKRHSHNHRISFFPEQSDKYHILQPSRRLQGPEVSQWSKGALRGSETMSRKRSVQCQDAADWLWFRGLVQKGCQLFFQRLHQEPGCQS